MFGAQHGKGFRSRYGFHLAAEDFFDSFLTLRFPSLLNFQSITFKFWPQGFEQYTSQR